MTLRQTRILSAYTVTQKQKQLQHQMNQGSNKYPLWEIPLITPIKHNISNPVLDNSSNNNPKPKARDSLYNFKNVTNNPAINNPAPKAFHDWKHQVDYNKKQQRFLGLDWSMFNHGVIVGTVLGVSVMYIIFNIGRFI